jgi:hypothetical protein
MDDDFIRRGGRVGGAIAFLMIFLPFCSMYVLSFFSPARDRLGVRITALPCSFVMAALMATIGSLIGKWAATRPTANSAFLRGGIISGLISVGLFAPLSVLGLLFDQMYEFIKYISVFLLLTILITACVSFLSGLTAICVRDCRQTGRKRLIPQFTLQEMLIVFSLLAVIMSVLASFAPLSR